MSSLLTPNHLPLQQSSVSFAKVDTSQPLLNASSMLTSMLRQVHYLTPTGSPLNTPTSGTSNSHFNCPLYTSLPAGKLRPYCASLEPVPSPLHPHCLTKEHLQLWWPSTPHLGKPIALTEVDLDHILYGQHWSMNNAQVKTALVGTTNLAPPSSKCPKRDPFTLPLIETLFSKLNPKEPLDMSVRACLAISFFTLAWLDKFTVSSFDSFDTMVHVKQPDVHMAMHQKFQEWWRHLLCSPTRGHLFNLQVGEPPSCQQPAQQWPSLHICPSQQSLSPDHVCIPASPQHHCLILQSWIA